MKPDERAARDAAGIGPYASDRERLVSMASLDNWHVPDGEPDIRGWELRTVSGRQLGKVQDLLIDAAGREVVMLDVDVPAENRHVCVPIRNVEIDRRARVVLMDSADFQSAASESTVASSVAPSVAASTKLPSSTERRSGMQRRADVDVTRAAAVDRAAGYDDIEPEDIAPLDAEDRRRAERRRIDRMGTDI